MIGKQLIEIKRVFTVIGGISVSCFIVQYDVDIVAHEFGPVVIYRAAEEAFLDLVRQDAAQLMRLRHPGVVRVIQALDESKTTMAMVTEPIFASVANVLGRLDNVGKVPNELKDLVGTFLTVYRVSGYPCDCVFY